MFPNAKASELVAVLASISPQALAVGNATTAWVSAKDFATLVAVVSTGTLGTAATVDAKFEQATDNAGTGIKNVTGRAIAQIVKASGDDKQALINLRPSDLDVEGGFAWVRLKITVGAATSQVGGTLMGVTGVTQPAYAKNAAAVVQVV